MYDSGKLLENKMELHFFGAGTHTFDEQTSFEGGRLPYELFLSVTESCAAVTLNGETETLSAGEVILIPYDTDFSVMAEAGVGLLYVAADYRVFTNLRIFSLFDLPKKLGAETVYGDMKLLLRLILDSEFTNYRMENALETKLLLYRLALAVVRKSYPKKESNMIMSRFERLAPVLSHIGEKLDKVCPVGELSALMGMSEDAFYRYFKSTIGRAPKDYLISERLRKARNLLAATDMSITDISKSCGYENPFYFSTLFHGKYGTSPSAYREKILSLMTYLT